MTKQILVIHEYSIIRHIIQHYVLTEHTQAIVDIAEDYNNGIEILKKKKYDIIITGLEMDNAGLNGFAVKNAISNTVNKKTPIVLLTTLYDQKQFDNLSEEFHHILNIPFTDLQLRNVIYQIIDPRKDRIYNRYAIDKTKAIVQIKEHEIEADVINLSKNGIFCEVNNNIGNINLLEPPLISLLFPSEYGNVKVRNIRGRVLRFTVKSWDANHFPKKIRIVWKFIDISNSSQSILERVLEEAYLNLKNAEEKACKVIDA